MDIYDPIAEALGISPSPEAFTEATEESKKYKSPWAEKSIPGFKGFTHTEETKSLMSQVHTERYKDPEERRRASAIQKKNCESEERRSMMKNIATEYWSDEDNRKKRSELYSSPEFSQKLSQSKQHIYKDPEYKKRMSESLKRYHAEKKLRLKQEPQRQTS